MPTAIAPPKAPATRNRRLRAVCVSVCSVSFGKSETRASASSALSAMPKGTANISPCSSSPSAAVTSISARSAPNGFHKRVGIFSASSQISASWGTRAPPPHSQSSGASPSAISRCAAAIERRSSPMKRAAQSRVGASLAERCRFSSSAVSKSMFCAAMTFSVKRLPPMRKLRENRRESFCMKQKSVCPAPMSTMILSGERVFSNRATSAIATIDGITAVGNAPVCRTSSIYCSTVCRRVDTNSTEVDSPFRCTL